MQLALGDALAIVLLKRRGFGASEFGDFHPRGKLGAALTCLRDIMHRDEALPLAPPDCPMSDAIVRMTEKGFGCLGIVGDDGKLAGIITDGDLRRHMDDGLLTRTAADIMTHTPKTLGQDALAADALRLMNDSHIQCLFVCEAGRPVGLVRILDLLHIGIA